MPLIAAIKVRAGTLADGAWTAVNCGTPERGRYHYRVRSNLDVGNGNGDTAVDFDLYSGRLLDVYRPTGQHSGRTVTQWLYALHEAKLFDLPYRMSVCVPGLAAVMLSVPASSSGSESGGRSGFATHVPSPNRPKPRARKD